MLLSLHVKNLVLIDEAEVFFGPGLNILSGETGAGKSIIIGSVNLALGEKAAKSMIRKNADYALIELVFSVDQPHQIEALHALDVFPEEDTVIMSRKIMASGRSICKINSETVSAALMRKVASLLIDIHGQHEHQSLLAKKNHLKYLDAYAAEQLEDSLPALSSCYHTYVQAQKALEDASMDAEQQARELSFLQYEIKEIEEAGLRPGEDAELEAEYHRLSHAQKIMEACAEASELCTDGAENAADQISRAVRALGSAAAYDETVDGLSGQLQEIENLLNDFNRELSQYIQEFEFSDETFSQIEQRLDQINHLKSKYGKTIEIILEEKDKKERRAEQLEHLDEYRAELEKTAAAAKKQLDEISGRVSAIRKEQAVHLTGEITEALRALNFADVRFKMEFRELDHDTAKGRDDARFLISTNPGEEERPLDEIASGGELSRIMLAIKTVLAENDEIETLIFDEIDSGISGRTAQMVAEKIKLTASSHQIICITHLPQIAAMADQHFLIEKTSTDMETLSRIRPLDKEESIKELARMLGGVSITQTVMNSAREMKELADSVR